MRKFLSFFTTLILNATPFTFLTSCMTIDVKIRQSFSSWTYSVKTDDQIYGTVFNKDKTENNPYFSYWFVKQILTSANFLSADKTWYQIMFPGSIVWTYPSSTDITIIDDNWFIAIINKLDAPNRKINVKDLESLFLYLTIYNPVIILTNKIFAYQYRKEQSNIKIEFLYKTPTDIANYKTLLQKNYNTFYSDTLTVKYPKLTKYFLEPLIASQRLATLVDTLIRVITIMTPTFMIALNINTNN